MWQTDHEWVAMAEAATGIQAARGLPQMRETSPTLIGGFPVQFSGVTRTQRCTT